MIQDGLARRHRRPAHPARKNGLAIEIRKPLDLLRCLSRIGHGLRSENDQEAVRAAVLRDNLHRLRVTLRVRIPKDIDRVAVTPVRRQKLVQLLDGLLRQRGQVASVGSQRVSSEYSRTARIGHDGQARTLGSRLGGQHFRHVEQVRDGLDTQDARPAEGGIQHVVTARESARVRSGGLGGGFAAARLDDDDRLRERHLTSGR